ncbi:hypothetical protein GCM10009678_86970 [Actinomadura kijaniata]|uniref:Uncharacterized protein n=1 Tax=Actinomadura namibiensis TaxID=182080 RepID=A0A7W3LW59_ACTNM|nr:hypothetical protein [Actinomadura namibiensis]MBA8955371.1 hypothetical protein [Actinomadura namibiensis]
MTRRDRPHKIWPITVITLVLLWILLITLLIHFGPRLKPWPEGALPAPPAPLAAPLAALPAALPAAQDPPAGV